ncbi:MAG: thioredoxin family protein [Actinobacteria bacterium]|nr:thioredoxin family protein [Actinomycetota bacterium]
MTRLLVVVALGAAVWVLASRYRAWRDANVNPLDLPPLPGDVAGPNATWVVFTTEYCATCGPVKERIARIDPTADLIEIDVADRPDLARRYHVRTAPTVLFAAANGRVHARFVGNVPDDQLASVRR